MNDLIKEIDSVCVLQELSGLLEIIKQRKNSDSALIKTLEDAASVISKLIEEINKIPAAQIWTPINEKEPPRGNVLVTLACGRQCAVHECNWEDMKRRIEIYKGAQSALDRFFVDHAIAWAPMPEPYVSRIEKSQFLMEIDEWRL